MERRGEERRGEVGEGGRSGSYCMRENVQAKMGQGGEIKEVENVYPHLQVQQIRNTSKFMKRKS